MINGIADAITYFFQAVTQIINNIFRWQVGFVQDQYGNVIIGMQQVLEWYLCLTVGMYIVMRIIGGSHSGGKKDA